MTSNFNNKISQPQKNCFKFKMFLVLLILVLTIVLSNGTKLFQGNLSEVLEEDFVETLNDDIAITDAYFDDDMNLYVVQVNTASADVATSDVELDVVATVDSNLVSDGLTQVVLFKNEEFLKTIDIAWKDIDNSFLSDEGASRIYVGNFEKANYRIYVCLDPTDVLMNEIDDEPGEYHCLKAEEIISNNIFVHDYSFDDLENIEDLEPEEDIEALVEEEVEYQVLYPTPEVFKRDYYLYPKLGELSLVLPSGSYVKDLILTLSGDFEVQALSEFVMLNLSNQVVGKGYIQGDKLKFEDLDYSAEDDGDILKLVVFVDGEFVDSQNEQTFALSLANKEDILVWDKNSKKAVEFDFDLLKAEVDKLGNFKIQSKTKVKR